MSTNKGKSATGHSSSGSSNNSSSTRLVPAFDPLLGHSSIEGPPSFWPSLSPPAHANTRGGVALDGAVCARPGSLSLLRHYGTPTHPFPSRLLLRGTILNRTFGTDKSLLRSILFAIFTNNIWPYLLWRPVILIVRSRFCAHPPPHRPAVPCAVCYGVSPGCAVYHTLQVHLRHRSGDCYDPTFFEVESPVFTWVPGWFSRILSCLPPRSVSGLVWVIGPPICCTEHVCGVVGCVVDVVLDIFHIFFLVVFGIDVSLSHASSSPPPRRG